MLYWGGSESLALSHARIFMSAVARRAPPPPAHRFRWPSNGAAVAGRHGRPPPGPGAAAPRRSRRRDSGSGPRARAHGAPSGAETGAPAAPLRRFSSAPLWQNACSATCTHASRTPSGSSRAPSITRLTAEPVSSSDVAGHPRSVSGLIDRLRNERRDHPIRILTSLAPPASDALLGFSPAFDDIESSLDVVVLFTPRPGSSVGAATRIRRRYRLASVFQLARARW